MKEALTFDDVLLEPAYSEVLPKEVDIKAKLTNKISLNIPIISAAMDTVTESRLAIALAREGGVGIIHKNLSIEQQAKEVDKVKRSESGMILDPITLPSTKTIRDAVEIMATYHISGVPVVDEGKLVGILTNRDIRFETNLDLPITSRMTSENLVTVKKGTTLEKAKAVLQENRIEKLLVVDDDGTLCGLITVKDILKKESHPNASADKHGRLLVGAAVGVSDDTMDRASALVEAQVDILIVDTAHGHSKGVLDTIKKIRKQYSNIELIAGNVATGDGAMALIDAGVDAVKVGIGAGSICTTRVIAGVGVPQLTAIQNVCELTAKYGISVISDGGIRYSGDVAKSIAAGASSVMLGGVFAGTDESPGEYILYEGRSFKSYRGMGSLAAMKAGSKDRYFQDGSEANKLVPEGIEGMVPYKGPLKDTVHQLVGGLRASMGYCGVRTIDKFHKNAKFVKITSSGVKENHPHDVNITKESPNYRKPQ
ncbi:MAG: IMP dehydrogenase [Candidatus Marinimicrobia bacterium]|nr:IMP dehydrogenase [Candidatus Neomarinimicrobiota bacterium]MBL7022664.1 IMP dehydrogenase [Candidatus Neomarinimicrobiota bacterium]